MHLTIRHLQVFHALLAAGSITRAADMLNVSRPAISIALSRLEEEVGFRLFHRQKGFFAPTAEAMLLHSETERSLLSIERVQSRVREIQAGTVGTISLASNGALAINVLPWVIARFHETHPEVKVDLKVRSSRKIAEWVAGRQVDIGMIDAPVPVPDVDATIIELPCVCIMRADDRLAGAACVTPNDLDGRSVVAITGDHPIDRRLERACAARGVTIRRRVVSGYFAIARNMVRAGAALALVDVLNGTAELGDGVVARPFEPVINFELALLLPLGQPLSNAASAFLTGLRERLPGARG
jgi:DNA-binding transcriptional LysR family regulator